MNPTTSPTRRWPAMMLLALVTAFAPNLAGCATDDALGDEDDVGIEDVLEETEPLGKADDAGVPGPKVSTWTADTQVWTARNKWEDTDTDAAREAGLAWGADSGLNWDQKYQRWIESMTRTSGHNTYFETFTLTTPWGKELPAPKLECAEMAIFLRVTFASWYELPFYMTSTDSSNTRVYFGHFGARTKTSRYKNTPKFGHWYKDHSSMTVEQIANEGWPQDAKLRGRGLYGGGDEMDFIFEGSLAGGYFDEIYLNKRVGHFMRFLLGYFGSMHLASSRNTFNIKPEALSEGDVLVERWQRQGIGHTLIVKSVEQLEGGTMEAQLVSGSMPRRQPKWETGVSSKNYFTSNYTGGEGTNNDGEEYAKLGGGIKRWRVTKNINGYWTNTWMAGDEASWISDSDTAAIAARPARFQDILGEVSPEDLRDALLAIVEDNRNHLRQYPASCSARIRREEAFDKLYTLAANEFDMDRATVDANYRILEDYVFGELEYTESKTCCWNSTNSAMFQIAMDYNESLQENACTEPVVFRAENGGYEIFKNYAEQTGRGEQWKPWTEDESCPQRDTVNDVIVDFAEASWCDIADTVPVDPPTGGECSDAYDGNDSSASAANVSEGSYANLQICGGDSDYFSLSCPAGSTMTVRIDFTHDSGDLDMVLTQGGSEIDRSQSVVDHEEISVSDAGAYMLRVYGYNGAENGYSLSVNYN